MSGDKKAAAIFVGVIVLVFSAVLVIVQGSNKDVTEDSSTSRTALKYQTYCLKGLTVLKVEGGESVATTISGFMYELDKIGHPIPCGK